ncbi:glycerophosphodiester phosphodiesterase [Flammeovirga sp. EKP202]|uniref:glycerophosphodiester phosphodiesterase n=1 Tax=Flammeovirga sp. EKP202 TaxID=2770592 RepID=UPI00165FDB89|nr:glycerophosphodiester phosphodiesterase [Flammeovirga sp. EKP202]MBD0401367.1 glycerophosphodiester phosphodiesterase [Flammeovirga sp. EKP202]
MKQLTVIFILLLTSCQNKPQVLDLQGHRGCRGVYPENTTLAFIRALEVGVTTLEMDVVISKDKKVVVSHEPFFSHEIATSPDGKYIEKENELDHNLYEMTYSEIKEYDVGLRKHLRFPNQKKLKAYKPLLSEVIENAEKYAGSNGINKPFYNIEIKRDPKYDNIYHPEVEEFVRLVLNEINQLDIKERVTIQSFDVGSLQEVKRVDPSLKLVLLIENTNSLEDNLQKLGFNPEVYSPYYELVTEELVAKCHQENIKLIPWTVNEEDDILEMIQLNVDGIITDYPQRLKNIMEEEGIRTM